MIDFTISEDQQIILDAVARFVRQELAPGMREAEQARTPSPAVVRHFEALGLMGLERPGTGLGMLTRCLVNAALAGGDAGAALALDRVGPAAHALLALGGDDLVDAIATDPNRRAWCATLADGQFRIDDKTIDGVLHWAPGGVTDLCILLPDGIALVRDGLHDERVRGSGLRAAAPVRVRLDRASLAQFRQTDPAPALDAARLYTASLLLGVLEAAASYARTYAQERVAFGRPIAHHQALAFLLVDMNTAVTGARLLLHDAAWRFDAGYPAAEAIATAFAELIDQSRFIGPNGVQVLGGLGFMQDYPVEKYMREARALGLLHGGIDQARADAMRATGTALMAGGLI
jgi:alkylation response protein AidB-like acyl-CoA dehydrogenase